MNETFSYLKVTHQDDIEEFEQAIERQSAADQACGEGSFQSDEPENQLTKNNGSLLGRKGLNRRNSLQAERSRTMSAKKQTMAPTKSEGTIQNPNITGTNKRLSLHDLPKSNTSTGHLMPPPRIPPGQCPIGGFDPDEFF